MNPPLKQLVLIFAKAEVGGSRQRAYDRFRELLKDAMPKEVNSEQLRLFKHGAFQHQICQAYVYPASTLHCTICTFRAFTGGEQRLKIPGFTLDPLKAQTLGFQTWAGPLEDEGAIGRWQEVLEKAKVSEHWPKGQEDTIPWSENNPKRTDKYMRFIWIYGHNWLKILHNLYPKIEFWSRCFWCFLSIFGPV